jgi:hypothetical protein
MARVVERPISGLHILAGDKREGDLLPAPAQLSIAISDDGEVTMMIEEHIRYERYAGEYTINARLSLPFVRAFASWDASSLPRVTGITELPLVLPDRRLRATTGLDRELGLIMQIPAPLRDALEKTPAVTIEQAREDYRWLCETWFVDVDTDAEGKAVVIALALSLIERHLLPERPAFFITAAQRGSGKTTLLHMVSTAVTGNQAAAASWSFVDEERRKALFSYLRETAAMVVYDNIPRGSKVSCPTIERALTSSELSDRVLGESRTETVPTATILAFTGNNVGPKGDLASRSLVASLCTNRPDPENRDFQHSDPIGWTRENRLEILRRLFNILRCKRQQLETARTRFKRWYRLVGHPVELVADVDFEEIFRANDATDEEAQGLADFFSMMIRFLKSGGRCPLDFTAAEVTGLLEGHSSSKELSCCDGQNFEKPDQDDLKASLEAASGRPFPTSTGSYSSHRSGISKRVVGIKLNSIEGRPVEVDGTLYSLVVIKNHERNTYRIEPPG